MAQTWYEYSDGNLSCGHKHRSEATARRCPLHLRLIRQWWRDSGFEGAFVEYRRQSIAKAEIIPSCN